MGETMKRLYVLYDKECGLCRRCLLWLRRQPAFVPLVFMPYQSLEASCRFPGIEQYHPEKEIMVISDTGEFWQGGPAWVMCLWALREYREWSQRLAHPLLLPLARRACALVSENRFSISRLLVEESPTVDLLQARIAGLRAPDCDTEGACGVAAGATSAGREG